MRIEVAISCPTTVSDACHRFSTIRHGAGINTTMLPFFFAGIMFIWSAQKHFSEHSVPSIFDAVCMMQEHKECE